MEIVVRAFRPDDSDEVARLADRLTEGVATWRDRSAVARAVRDWVNESTSSTFAGVGFVAVDHDRRVVGFLSLSTASHFSGDLDAYIGELVVAAEAEGHGVGAELVAAAEDRARSDGRRCITLTTGAANARARRFYRRLGYSDEDVTLTKVLTE